ncbi:MAG: Fe-S cluster protein [Desulfococcus sp. 4484_241]|nr:MAG: Fe-S cluster protein [Desulfococcus sp. 4484_241]
MALSVIDLYRDVLPKTNCGDCGFKTCMAFAGMVVSERLPIRNCPHLDADVVASCEKKLQEQYDSGKWLKKNPAKDALLWAKKRSASMVLEDLPKRIGGRIVTRNGTKVSALPYFNKTIFVSFDTIVDEDGLELNMWEQVFIYNHIAQNGSAEPSNDWKGFSEFPNTVSKIKSMEAHIEKPIADFFSGSPDRLLLAAKRIGGVDKTKEMDSADVAILFSPLPKVPVMLLFWDVDQKDGFEAQVKLLFDATVTQHLDIESIMFLSERIYQLLCR